LPQPADASARRSVVISGGAGLVGQNLIQELKRRGYDRIVSLDKSAANTAILKRLNPDVEAHVVDLARDPVPAGAFEGQPLLVCNHAQIGGLDGAEFERNNVEATRRLMDAARAATVPYVVSISSSVVNSIANDHYVRTKTVQEKLVASYPIPQAVLRPTLMFGWFDRKHLGWLRRFMGRMPVFPVPGHGRYTRQPLFVGDFCRVIAACLDNRKEGAWNISGLEKVDYIDIIREIKSVTRAPAVIVNIPYGLFHALLMIYAAFDKSPPFTTSQLAALVLPEEFEMIDWPHIFGFTPTPWRDAVKQTFAQKPYCDVTLEF
jgi:nucleoside-diphosphate-sugar epimerase